MSHDRHKWTPIPQLPRAHYEIDVEWKDVERMLVSWGIERGLIDLSPDYQRAHVWTEAQRVAYIEYVLSGGEVGKSITWNSPGWQVSGLGDLELVDGKQRLEAVRSFIRGETKAFGLAYQAGDVLRFSNARMQWRVCSLATRAEVLQLYLNINAGGTPHTPDEIARVCAMLAEVKS